MSFSVNFIGRPKAIKHCLKEESAKMGGQSKREFDSILPALETILDQNSGLVSLEASGHANFDVEGKKVYGTCNVQVKSLGSQLAEGGCDG